MGKSALGGSLLTAIVIVIAGVGLISSPASAVSSNLTVMGEGLKGKQGHICARLFAQSNGFPDRQDKATANQSDKQISIM